jgi:ribose 5-phosphate isomerase A
MIDTSLAKRAAARAAADLVTAGLKVGLGSGSTVAHVIERLAERRRDDKLEFVAVAVDPNTADAARRAELPLVPLDDVDRLDLAIDGADEVDPQKNLLKGRGGSAQRERILAAAAKELIVVVDDSKLVPVLGKGLALPIEIAPVGWKQTERRLLATNCKVVRREMEGAPFRNDGGNLLLECKYDGIDDPAWLDEQLNALVGVVDHGLFVGMTGRLFVADQTGKVRLVP